MTKGAEKLLAWRTREGLTQREVAVQLEINPTEISDLERGTRRPALRRAVEISHITGGYVSPEDWLKEARAA